MPTELKDKRAAQEGSDAEHLRSWLFKKLINKASHEQVNSKAGQKIKRVIYCEPGATKNEETPLAELAPVAA